MNVRRAAMREIIVCSCRSMIVTQTCLGVMSMLLSVPRHQSRSRGHASHARGWLAGASASHVRCVPLGRLGGVLTYTKKNCHGLWSMPIMLTGHAIGMPVMLERARVCQSRTIPVILASMPVMLAGACQSAARRVRRSIARHLADGMLRA
jgi:hypothetical protein